MELTKEILRTNYAESRELAVAPLALSTGRVVGEVVVGFRDTSERSVEFSVIARGVGGSALQKNFRELAQSICVSHIKSLVVGCASLLGEDLVEWNQYIQEALGDQKIVIPWIGSYADFDFNDIAAQKNEAVFTN